MTLIVLEGPSKSGKSTVRDKILEEKPQYVMMKGENLMRKGMGDHWNEYQRRYHEMLHRLYELNPENVIVADRAFSDIAYNTDEQIRKEMQRVFACYGDVHILYFYPGTVEEKDDGRVDHSNDGVGVLRERDTRDHPKLHNVLHGYEDLLEMLPYTHVNTEEESVQSATVQAIDTIQEVHSDTDHDPDV